MPKQKKYRWTKTNATTWGSNAERGYTGTIVFSSGSYTLTVSPGGYTTTRATLKSAKGDFRKFLLDKS